MKVQNKYKFHFQHMPFIGHSEFMRTAPPENKPSSTDELYLRMRDRINSVIPLDRLEQMAQHTDAINDIERYMKSLYKCDALPIKPDNEIWELAQEFTYQMLAPLVKGCGSSTTVDYNAASSNGVMYNKVINPDTGKPFKNKGEFLASQYGRNEVLSQHVPVINVAGKQEFLPSEEVKDGKMRTYFICDTSFVMKQKLLYDAMDERLLQNATNYRKCWSRYGFVRQYGGFHNLAQAHLNFLLGKNKRWIVHKTSDVSGWDRLLPIMREIYKLRQRLFGDMTPTEKQWHDLIAAALEKPYCSLFNGDIFQRQTGNCSGSGKTTSDNTIGHIMIEFYVFATLYFMKHDRLPTYDEIVDNVLESLYGDDDLGTFALEDWVPDHIQTKEEALEWFKDVYQQLYRHFGLTIKDKAFAFNFYDLERLEFLGGTFTYNKERDLWVAIPRMSKVATTMIRNLETKRDIKQYVSILEALSALLYDVPDPDAKYVYSLLPHYADEITLHPDWLSLEHSLQMFVLSVASRKYSGDYLVHGFESQSPVFLWNEIPQSNNFFSQERFTLRDRVGFKSEEMQNNNAYNPKPDTYHKLMDFGIDPNYSYNGWVFEERKFSFNPNTNYKGWVLEHLPVSPQNYYCEQFGQSHCPYFKTTIKYSNLSVIAIGRTKKESEHKASYKLYLYAEYVMPYRQFLDVDPSLYINKDENFKQIVASLHKRSMKHVDNFISTLPLSFVPTLKADEPIITPVKISRLSQQPLPPTQPVLKIQTSPPPPQNFTQPFVEDGEEYTSIDDNHLKHGTSLPGGFFVESDVLSTITYLISDRMLNGEDSILMNKELDILIKSRDVAKLSTWLYSFIKTGSFNPYGNGQTTTQYTITKPDLVQINTDSYVVTSTCLLPGPTNIVGSGSTPTEAFEAWHAQIDMALEKWAPDTLKKVKEFFSAMRTLPRPNNSLAIYWDKSVDESFQDWWSSFMEGSFNPYGNGQPASQWVQSFMEGSFNPYGNGQPNNNGKALSKKQWAAKKKNQGLTPAQIDIRYSQYLKSKARKAYNGYVAQQTANRVQRTQNIKKNQMTALTELGYKPRELLEMTKRTNGPEERVKVKMSGCARNYAAATRCPFWWKDGSCDSKIASLNIDGSNPCIPAIPAVKTRKFYNTAAGTFGAPNGGSPFIAFAPWRLANDYVTNTDTSCPVLYSRATDPAAIANAFPSLDTGIAWTSGATSLNSDYTSASLITTSQGVGIKYRVVAAGLRVKYDGAPINASGYFAGIEQPDHYTLSNLQVTAASKFETYFTRTVNQSMKNADGWVYLTYTPTNIEDFNFQRDHTVAAEGGLFPWTNHFMGFLIPGAPTGNNYFMWEAIVHYEATGQLVTGKTDTPSDPVGLSTVLNSNGPSKQDVINSPEPVSKALNEGLKDLSSNVNTLLEPAKAVMKLAAL